MEQPSTPVFHSTLRYTIPWHAIDELVVTGRLREHNVPSVGCMVDMGYSRKWKRGVVRGFVNVHKVCTTYPPITYRLQLFDPLTGECTVFSYEMDRVV